MKKPGPSKRFRKPSPGKPARKRHAPAPSGGDNVLIYGLHAVRAALRNPHRHKRVLYVSENARQRLAEDVHATTVQIVDARRLEQMVGPDAVHQGAVLECLPLETLDASELFHLADCGLLLVLDQITDPHNVGAILRSAVAFGVDAVLVTARNSAVETGVLAKSASGALDMVRVITLRNLSKGLEELNAMGFQTIGLDSEGPAILEETFDDQRRAGIAIVLGSEGSGLREKTRLTCRDLARLDMPGEIKSLNVSNAAALALYVARRRIA